jgi:ABC-type branched-subunit amino acid transport system permease subunit
MQTMLHADDAKGPSRLFGQAVSFFMHSLLALGSWLALMLAGYALNPPGISLFLILILSMLVPFVVGNIVTRFRQDEMATLVWLVGLIWMLIVSLWILDMPTGPNACFQCDATEKLSRTFFSLPKPSGLIDDDGPILGTWPAAALIGYAIGARLALKRRPPEDE